MALRVIRDEPEGAAGRQLHVSDLKPLAQASHKDVFTAPVKLECFAVFKRHRHERTARRLLLRLAPCPNEGADTTVAPVIAGSAEVFIHLPPGASLALRPSGVRDQPHSQLLGPWVDDAAILAFWIARHILFRLSQPM